MLCLYTYYGNIVNKYVDLSTHLTRSEFYGILYIIDYIYVYYMYVCVRPIIFLYVVKPIYRSSIYIKYCCTLLNYYRA